mgnify:CR=1 FL=1
MEQQKLDYQARQIDLEKQKLAIEKEKINFEKQKDSLNKVNEEKAKKQTQVKERVVYRNSSRSSSGHMQERHHPDPALQELLLPLELQQHRKKAGVVRQKVL